MITNKDIRVENGSLIINGDPYPLDGQSPEAIMQIVKDNSDTIPTEDSIKPITSGGVYSKIGDLSGTGVTGDTVADQIEAVNNDITTINAQITPNNLGSGNYVDLTAYTLESPYTATNDGYVLVNSQNSNSIKLKVEAVMSTGTGSSTIKTFAATDTYQGDGVFIRKGMKIYGTRSLTTTGFVRFYPLQ